MSRQLIINATPNEARVATVENGRLLQIDIERSRHRSAAGRIYKGRVLRVLPGIQAAFVDIGLPKAAFLPSADLIPIESPEGFGSGSIETGEPPLPPPIEERLSTSQELLVQVSKEPIGSKGARVTANISLPGRLVVLLPATAQIAVSRRIEDEDERARLRAAVAALGEGPGGVIIRTACEGVPEEEIQSDLHLLRRIWQQIHVASETAASPTLLHEDLDVVLRTIRDLHVLDVSRVVVDDAGELERIAHFIETVMPTTGPRLELYEEVEPIFDRYDIETKIEKALQPRVWLRSGGYIVIDPTEALTSIDVNTGRFVGKTDQRMTALRTNLEAATAIAEQLRLRDIGGVIVIDFIDMASAEDRDSVLTALNDALQEERTRAEVNGFSPLGLVEMTRHRTRESVAQQLCSPCPTCHGKGVVRGVATTAYDVLRTVHGIGNDGSGRRHFVLTLHDDVAAFLQEFEPDSIANFGHKEGVEIAIETTTEGSSGHFRLEAVPAHS